MNKFVLLGLLGLLLMPLGYSTVADNLVAYFGLEETAGTTAYNNVDYNFDGTNNGATVNQACKIGKCYWWDSANDDINLGAPTVNSQSFTWSAWIKTNDTNGDMAQYGAGSNTQFRALSTKLYINAYLTQTGGGSTDCSSTTVINDNVWHYVVVTGNSSGFWNAYVDGNWECRTAGTITSYAMISNMRIGTLAGGSGDDYSGLIDEFSMENRTVSASEILTRYNAGNGLSYLEFLAGAPNSTVIYNYNVTTITSNLTWLYSNASDSYFVEFNSANNFLFRAYNSSGVEVTQNLTIYSNDLGGSYATGRNFTSGTNLSLTMLNTSLTHYTLNITNPYNFSVYKLVNVYINDVKNVTYSNTTTFFKYNTTQALNFTMFLNDSSLTCNDYFNLSIPALNISQQLVKSCDLTSINFNNSAVYNYTAYLTNNRFSRTINNTYYFVTANINISMNYTSLLFYTQPNYINLNYSFFGGQTLSPTYSFNWNGTTYNTLNATITTSSLSSNSVNITLYYNISVNQGSQYLNYTGIYYQILYKPIYDNCSSYTYQVLNLTFYDEITEALVNASLKTKITTGGIDYFFDHNNVTQASFCLNQNLTDTADVTLEYSGNNYRTREYYILDMRLNASTVYKDIFLIDSTNGQLMKWLITDPYGAKYPGYYIEVLKLFFDEGYKTVAMDNIDFESIGQTYIEYYSPAFYKVIVRDASGNMVYTSEGKHYDVASIPTTLTIYSTNLNYYEKIGSVTVSDSVYNNVTNLYSILVSDISGYLSSINFKVINYDVTNIISSTTICDYDMDFETTEQPYCNLTGYNGRFNTYLEGTFTDGSSYPLYTETFYLSTTQTNYGKNNELFLTLLLCGGVGIAVSIVSGKIGFGLITFSVGLLASSFMGVFKGEEGSLIGIVILLGGLGLWGLKSNAKD